MRRNWPFHENLIQIRSQFRVNHNITCNPIVHFQSTTSYTFQRLSLVTNPSSGHGDTNRSIDLPSFRSTSFRVVRHRYPSDGANGRRCSSKHQVPPSIAAILFSVTSDLHVLSFNAGSIWHNKLPPACCRTPVGDGCAAEEGGCHGDWCHFC